MIDGLRDAIDAIEARRRTITVFAPSPAVAAEVADQFATKNVAVTHESLPPYADATFLVVRDGDGTFLGAVGRETLDRLLSPTIHPPWVLAESDVDYAEVFDFLENTLFTAFDRRQLLATAREIEERAWRVADGRLVVGFQRPAALAAQTEVYDHLADRGALAVTALVSADWDDADDASFPVTVATAGEIGAFWFLVFDGGGSDHEKCALVAEEREEGRYYGFWTYDPSLVDDLLAHLDAEYGLS